MSQGPKKRIKSKSITMYIDPKYTDKVNYLKHTSGLTNFVERALDALEVDPAKMRWVTLLEADRKYVVAKDYKSQEDEINKVISSNDETK